MHLLWLRQINLSLTLHCMSLKYYDRKVYDKRNGQICCPQKCKVKFGKNIFSQTFLSERIFLHEFLFSQSLITKIWQPNSISFPYLNHTIQFGSRIILFQGPGRRPGKITRVGHPVYLWHWAPTSYSLWLSNNRRFVQKKAEIVFQKIHKF